MAKALTGAKQNRLGAIQAGYWGAFANVGVPGARDELNIIGPLKAANGSRRTPYFAPAAAPRFVVTKTSDARKLASMRLGDFFMTDVFSDDPKKIEVGLNLWHGPTGWTRPQGKLGLDGKPALYEWTFKWGEPTNKFIGNLYWLFEPAKIRGAMAALGGNEWDGEKLMWDATKDLYEPYSTDMVVPPIVFPTDRSSKLGETKQILSDYMLEGIASFITGERDVATQWNAFLKEIDDLGFQTYLSAVQNAYNAMYKK
jgi:putative aldouronate transport system substrate-binding protein